jgi:uncharacterized lipoprotein YbaY
MKSMTAALVLLCALGCGGAAVPKGRPEARVGGLVWYRERIALPPGSLVQVDAVDGDRVVGHVEIHPQGENPIPWELRYDPSEVKGPLSFRARVLDGNKVLFQSEEPVPLSPTVKIVVARPREPKKQVTGQVIWKQGEVPTAGASCVIRLGDAGTVLGETAVPMADPPITFAIPYDPSLIDPARAYEVTARVVVAGKPVLIAPAVAVITEGKPTEVKVVLLPVVEPKPLLGADAVGSVQAYLRGAKAKPKGAEVDLDGDGDKDAVVFVDGPDFCTAGACTLLVLEAVPAGYRLLSRIAGVRRPIYTAGSSTKGWGDLIVAVTAGRRPKLAALRFDGERYPASAASAPAAEAKGARLLLK